MGMCAYKQKSKLWYEKFYVEKNPKQSGALEGLLSAALQARKAEKEGAFSSYTIHVYHTIYSEVVC